MSTVILYNDTTIATCYDYKGNAYKPGETYIEFKGGRTWWVSLMWKDVNQLIFFAIIL